MTKEQYEQMVEKDIQPLFKKAKDISMSSISEFYEIIKMAYDMGLQHGISLLCEETGDEPCN